MLRSRSLALGLILASTVAAQAVAQASDQVETFRTSEQIAGQTVQEDVVAENFEGLLAEHQAAKQQAARASLANMAAVTPASDIPINSALDLPDTWDCPGQPTGSDDTSHALSNGPTSKVLYAYTTDRGNHFSEWASTLQQSAKRSMNMVAQASADGSRGTGRTLRYDLGTVCSSKQIDIRVVALPHSGSEYSRDLFTLIKQLAGDVRLQTGTTGATNQIALVDGINGAPNPGVAENPLDPRPGAANDAQIGGHVAFLFPSGPPSEPFYTFDGDDPLDIAAMLLTHEVLHMLGAVNTAAPHSDSLHHTTQQDDIMSSNNSSDSPCGDINNTFFETDCGGEDYWSPNPTPGSYLASHWNIVDSVHLCPVSLCTVRSRVPAGRIVSSASSPPIGQTVSFDASSFTDDDGDAIVRYQWDLDGNGSYDAEGATASTAYSTAGTRTVRLRVTDATGEFSLQTTPVTVPGPQQTTNTTTQTNQWTPQTGSQLATANAVSAATGGLPFGIQSAPVKWAFNLKNTPTRQKGRTVLKSGIRVKGYATRSGSVSITLKIGKTKIGSGKIAVSRAGTFSAAIKLTSAGRKKLKKRPVKVKVSGLGAAGGSDAVSITVSK